MAEQTRRIALVGGPSSGKSTLAAYLFASLKEKGLIAELVQEYAREYINRVGGVRNILNQYLFYEKQREKEDIIPNKVQYVITDSPTLLSYVYAVRYGDLTDLDQQNMLIDMYSKFLRDLSTRYQYVYYLEPTRPYVLDGTRQQTADEAKIIGNSVKEFLNLHKVQYKVLDMPETDKRASIILKDII